MERAEWVALGRAVAIAVIAIAMGSLFVTTYTLALGQPVPHRLHAGVVGTPRAGALAAVERAMAGKLVLHRYPSVAAARAAIEQQQIYAALDFTGHAPVLYVASASGASVARVLERAQQASPDLRVADAKPLPPSDPQGIDVFYLMLAGTILGFVTVFQLRANASGFGLRHWVAVVVVFALAASFALSLVTGPLLHRIPLPFLETWGILALQVLTAAAFCSTMAVLIGRWAIIPTWLFFVVLGNTSSGGAVSPPLLPAPFAIISQWLPSGATVTALRNAVYFNAHQHARPLVTLAAWTVAALAAMYAVSHRRGASPGIP